MDKETQKHYVQAMRRAARAHDREEKKQARTEKKEQKKQERREKKDQRKFARKEKKDAFKRQYSLKSSRMLVRGFTAAGYAMTAAAGMSMSPADKAQMQESMKTAGQMAGTWNEIRNQKKHSERGTSPEKNGKGGQSGEQKSAQGAAEKSSKEPAQKTPQKTTEKDNGKDTGKGAAKTDEFGVDLSKAEKPKTEGQQKEHQRGH